MITLFEKYENRTSKFNIGDIVVVNYYGDNELGMYKITNVQDHKSGGYFYDAFDFIYDKKIDGRFLESDLRLAKQSEIDKAEILKNSKKYNL